MFKRLNFLLGFLEINSPGIYQDYINHLIKTFEKMVKDKERENPHFPKIFEKYPHLKNQKRLTQLYFSYLVETTDLSNEENAITSELKIPSRIFWQLGFGVRYYEALALTKAMDREKAIELFKEYINQYYVSVESTFTKYETLEDMRKDHIDDVVKSTEPELDVILSSVEDGVYIVRNNNCPAIDALIDYEDKELVFLVCCFGDYQYAIMSNKHFVMTRDFTIAEGDLYCDKVFHDTRIDKEVKHPSKEFLDNMGPILKKNN